MSASKEELKRMELAGMNEDEVLNEDLAE